MPIGTALVALLGPLALVGGLRLVFGDAGPARRLPGCFIAGAAGGVLALIAEQLLWPLLDGLFGGVWGDIFRAFILIALVEEVIKLALIQARGSEGKDPDFAGFVIAAAAIGAGFAGAENLLYVHSYGGGVLLVRLLTATPFHVFNAVLAAWAIGQHLLGGRMEWLAGALLLSVFLHGLYDFLLIDNPQGNTAFLVALALVSLTAVAILRRLARAR